MAQKEFTVADQVTVEEIKTNIGNKNDTGGSTTLGSIFAKLNKLLTDWTTTRAGYIDTIKTDASNASTRAENARVAAVDAKTNTTTNNTASSTGTLSQKLTYIISSLIGTTSASGGTASAGTVMAKLNAIITALNNSSSSDLSELIELAYDTTQKSYLISSAVNSTGTTPYLLKSWTPTVDGIIELEAEVNSNHASGIPTIGVTTTSTATSSTAFPYSVALTSNYTTKQTVKLSVPVVKNQTIYIWIKCNRNSTVYCDYLKITDKIINRFKESSIVSAIKSVQHGVSNSSGNVTINPVNISKSIAFITNNIVAYGSYTSGGFTYNIMECHVELINSNTLKATTLGSQVSVPVYWAVIEFG